MWARRQADQDAGSSAGAADGFHAPGRKGDDMLINSSTAYQGDLVVLAVPDEAVFSLTISDTPNPGFIALRPPPAVDIRTKVFERNLRRHRQAEESRIRFLAAPRRPYAPRWRSKSCRSARQPAE